MGNISSANFKKSKAWQVYHNADVRPSYAIGGGLECNRGALDALELKNQIIQDAKDAYERNRKPKAPKFKATSYEWSLVVNLKESSTMQDLDKLAQHFQKKYGFQCYQIAIHRDEGHINELGEKVINHHAHLEFVTLDRETGKNRFRGEFVTPKGLRIVQDEVAEILQMERGVDKRLSGAKRIEPRAYAAMKEKEKLERAELVRENERLKTDSFLYEAYKEQNAALVRKNEELKEKIDEKAFENSMLAEKNADLAAENTKAKRIIKKARSQNATLKAKNAEFEKQRKEWVKEGGHTAGDYQALSKLKKACGEANLTIEQVTERINQFVARQKAESEQREQSRADRVSSATYFYNPDSRGSTPNGIISQTPKETILAQKQEIPQAPRELTPTPQTPQGVKISQNKTIKQDMKEVLEELGIKGIQIDYRSEFAANTKGGCFSQREAEKARDKLESRGYYVAIGAAIGGYFDLAFAKTKEKLLAVCEKVARLWKKTIYQTQERQDIPQKASLVETPALSTHRDLPTEGLTAQSKDELSGANARSAKHDNIIPQTPNQPKDNLDNQTPQEKMRARVSETLHKQQEPKRKQDDLEL